MVLSTEIILTLQQLEKVEKKGFGTKTILNISKCNGDMNTIDDLCLTWKTFKGKKYGSVTSADLYVANRMALKVIDIYKREEIGIISCFESQFSSMFRNCINEEGKEESVVSLYYQGWINRCSPY